MTVKAVGLGLFLALVFGAANAYLGMKAGQTVAATIPAAVIAMALFRLPAFREWTNYLMSWLDRRPADMRLTIEGLGALRIQQDPEAIFLEGWLQCEVGAHDSGLENLQRAIAKGYYVAPTLARSRHFDPLRSHPVFRAVLAQAESGRERSLEAFRAAGGERLLGRQEARGAA